MSDPSEWVDTGIVFTKYAQDWEQERELGYSTIRRQFGSRPIATQRHVPHPPSFDAIKRNEQEKKRVTIAGLTWLVLHYPEHVFDEQGAQSS